MVAAHVAPSFKSHVVEIRKGSDTIQGLAAFAANNLDDKADDSELKALPNNQGPDINATSPIRRILIQITHLKTSRKLAVGKLVFYSCLLYTSPSPRD